ncbi:MAG: asparaginase domain-containing protein [Gammaproteobacteria bacterium]
MNTGPTDSTAAVRILTTGGTIDKVYFDANSQFQVGEPQIAELLEEANVTLPTVIEPVLRKDSLELTAADRALIRDRVSAAGERHIVVTHGTDTLVETGRTLTDIGGKCIVLVGAMQPARLKFSDAQFNIGFALAAVQLLPDGVWVAMNGRIFDVTAVHKNREAMRFEAD